MATTEQPLVRLEGVRKRFGEVMAVADVTLGVPRNGFFALLGPSGCGKTTLLRLLAGFEQPSAGRILIDGEDATHVPPNRRPVNMVFQSYAVFPHMSVAENVAYGLKVTGVPRDQTRRRVGEALAMVRLEHLAQRKPDQLSGGQKQRVALARALVKRPKLLLLDEPLSALDRKLREAMQTELVQLQREVGIAFVIVTHDQQEALAMATEIAVMREGAVLQIAPPRQLYERPACRFVADFIGAMNLLPARSLGQGAIEVEGLGRLERRETLPATGTLTLGIRPEKLGVVLEEPSGSGPRLQGRIVQVTYLGASSNLLVELASGHRLSVLAGNHGPEGGSALIAGRGCWLTFHPDAAVLLAG